MYYFRWCIHMPIWNKSTVRWQWLLSTKMLKGEQKLWESNTKTGRRSTQAARHTDRKYFLIKSLYSSKSKITFLYFLYRCPLDVYIRDNFFTRVLTYLLPGVCINSLEHLEDFCLIRFSSLKICSEIVILRISV